MKTFTHSFLLFFVILLTVSSLSAQSVVSVNQYTGAAQATIPLWTVSSGQLGVPVMLGYSSNGIRVDQGSGSAGVGWQISAGGQITREVRDLPDDVSNNSTVSTSHYGWIHGGAVKVNAFVAAQGAFPNFDPSAYPLLSDFGGENELDDMYDMEPDVFRVSVPGHLSATFTLNEQGDPVLLDNQQLSISYVKDSFDSLILSFDVLTPGETRYRFEKHIEVETSIPDEATFVDLSNYRRLYYTHKGGQRYTTSWSLREINTPSGDEVNFLYGFGHNIYFDDGNSQETSARDTTDMEIFYYDVDSASYQKEHHFSLAKSYTFSGHLSAIDTKWERLTIDKNGIILPYGEYELRYPIITGVQVLDKRTSDTHVYYDFSYLAVESNDTTTNYSDLYLSRLKFSNNGSSGYYQFNYQGVSSTNKLVDRDSPDTDPYGFYSPRSVDLSIRKHHLFAEESGLNKVRFSPFIGDAGSYEFTSGFDSERPTVARVAVGSLQRVRLPLGGEERVSYELNRYHDSFSGNDEYGGGIRVKSIRVSDGTDPSRDVVLNYRYLQENGASSGVLMYKPTFYQLHPYQYLPLGAHNYYPDFSSNLSAAEALRKQISFSSFDLSEKHYPGYSVAYERTTVQKSGFGSTTTTFDIGRSAWNTYEVLQGGMRFSPDASASQTFLTGLTTADYLPFNHSMIYRFNGKPLEVVQKDEGGLIVSKVSYEYDTIGTSISVYGLKAEQMKVKASVDGVVDAYRWGYYQMEHGINEVTSRTVSQTYDPSDVTKFNEVTSEQTFDDLGRVMSSKTTDQESRVYRSYFQYPDAFNPSLSFEQQSPEIQAISMLQARGQIFQPIETYQTLEIGGTEHTIGGEMSVWSYDTLSNSIYPITSFMLEIGDPVTDFVASTLQETTTAEIQRDGRYEQMGTILSRNQYGGVISSISRTNDRSFRTYSNKGKYVSGVFGGAIDEEVVFDDFDSRSVDLVDYPTPVGVDPAVDGRVYGVGRRLSQGKIYYNFIPKETEYFFSCWIKSSTSETVTVKVMKGDTEIASVPLVVSGSGSWEYYSAPVSVSSDEQYIELSSSGEVSIDEVAFYPEDVSFSYTHLGTNGKKLAETQKGRTTYYEYDVSGDLRLIRDHELNIVQTYDYKQTLDSDTLTVSGSFIGKRSLRDEANVPIQFYVDGAEGCFSFKWNVLTQSAYESNSASLLDFSSPTGTSISNEYSHTFPDQGKYFIAVQMSCNGQDRFFERSIYIEEAPIVVNSFCFDRLTQINLNASDESTYKSGCSDTRIEHTLQLKLDIDASPNANYQIEWYDGYSSNNSSTGQMVNPPTYLVSSADGSFIPRDPVIGSGESISVPNYYDRWFQYKIVQYFVDAEGNQQYKRIEGPKVFFDAFYGSTVQN
ncbi:MAG: hypothetical protein HRT61_03385 [Ekhidna sp.]|nr:hypothetical protein [Ekhidna sp.]